MSEVGEARKCVLKFVAHIDHAEPAIRLIADATGFLPPLGMAAKEAIEKNWPEGIPFPFRRMATTAVKYLGECIEQGQQPS